MSTFTAKGGAQIRHKGEGSAQLLGLEEEIQ